MTNPTAHLCWRCGPRCGIGLRGSPVPRLDEILTPDALKFLGALARRFEARRQELLRARLLRQERLAQGEWPRFLDYTQDIRSGDWRVAPAPHDLRDRRVEITGPVDRKMVINALNSGAQTFMADFEDSNAPTWANCIAGQANLIDAVAGSISLEAGGKSYRLQETPATLLVRPRGWHLVEKHLHVDDVALSASLFDFGLFFFHNARALLARGTGPYFYLPKLESHIEARLWNDVFLFAQDELGLARGTIRATVLIETIMAAFEMDEILYELREHSSGLNCGRWDYIFSFIKRFRDHRAFVLPDRATVTMERHFLKSYVDLLIHTCHRRGAHAMGGMAAQIPIKNDPEANARALERVRADKLREVEAGHDGTWVAHPGLVPIAKELFDAHMPGPHQLGVLRPDVRIGAEDLLTVPDGAITEAGVRLNLTVGLRYLSAWLSGQGCVPIFHLMEDAATAEISRTQLWQWIRHEARLADGRTIQSGWVLDLLEEELQKLATKDDGNNRLELSGQLFERMITAETFPEFLTLAAYEHLD